MSTGAKIIKMAKFPSHMFKYFTFFSDDYVSLYFICIPFIFSYTSIETMLWDYHQERLADLEIIS